MPKSIFITGASAGIGRATAILFAEQGWFVGITDINVAGLYDLKDRLPGKISFAECLDVRDADQVAAVLSAFSQAAGGKIDVLFNNAGILRINAFENIPLSDHQAILDINAKGVLNCTYHAFPYLKAAGSAYVINMASVASLFAAPSEVTYAASKFWVKGFTEALNMEWERYGIHVCDIMPNFVKTTMVEQNPGKLIEMSGVAFTPEDVALAVFKALGSKRIHWLIDRPLYKLFYGLANILVPYSLMRKLLKRNAGF
ncbi:MAG: SDR family oxidoreductase [Syntrophaceae bacterium]